MIPACEFGKQEEHKRIILDFESRRIEVRHDAPLPSDIAGFRLVKLDASAGLDFARQYNESLPPNNWPTCSICRKKKPVKFMAGSMCVKCDEIERQATG